MTSWISEHFLGIDMDVPKCTKLPTQVGEAKVAAHIYHWRSRKMSHLEEARLWSSHDPHVSHSHSGFLQSRPGYAYQALAKTSAIELRVARTILAKCFLVQLDVEFLLWPLWRIHVTMSHAFFLHHHCPQTTISSVCLHARSLEFPTTQVASDKLKLYCWMMLAVRVCVLAENTDLSSFAQNPVLLRWQRLGQSLVDFESRTCSFIKRKPLQKWFRLNTSHLSVVAKANF